MFYSQRLLLGTIDERLERIKEKLNRVRSLPKGDEFGVKKHRFELTQPLSEEEVKLFEETHKIKLPEDYRAFITKLGAAGAGPYYGLLPLSRWEDVTFDDPHEGLLTGPCILTENMSSDWQSNELKNGREPYSGALPIVEQGCTYYNLLVLKGPFRGRVVNVDMNGFPPHFADNPDFLSWYERWLDHWLGGVDLFWYGFGPTGDEEELCHLLSTDRASGAATALGRLRQLTAVTLKKLLHCLDGDDDETRAEAIKTIGRRGGDDLVSNIAALVADDSAEVRYAVLWSLRMYHLEKRKLLSPLFEKALSDEDEEVLHYAIMTYKELPFCSKEKIEPFIDDKRKGISSMAKWVLGVDR